MIDPVETATKIVTLTANAGRAVIAAGPVNSGGQTVSDLLAASRAKHAEYQRYCPRFDPQSHQTIPGDAKSSRAALLSAAQCRAKAELLDPDHADSSWLAELGTTYEHDELLGFYLTQLTK